MFLRAAADADESGAFDVNTAIHWGETIIPPLYQAGKQLWEEQ